MLYWINHAKQAQFEKTMNNYQNYEWSIEIRTLKFNNNKSDIKHQKTLSHLNQYTVPNSKYIGGECPKPHRCMWVSPSISQCHLPYPKRREKALYKNQAHVNERKCPLCICVGDEPDSKVYGANMGPTWILSGLGWSHKPWYQGSYILQLHVLSMKLTGKYFIKRCAIHSKNLWSEQCILIHILARRHPDVI